MLEGRSILEGQAVLGGECNTFIEHMIEKSKVNLLEFNLLCHKTRLYSSESILLHRSFTKFDGTEGGQPAM